MNKIHQKEPIVPCFVDMGLSVLLAVSYGDANIQRFVRDENGKLVEPVGVYGLSYFTIQEVSMKIRYLSRSDDEWLNRTGEFLKQALDCRYRLDRMQAMGLELVFCLVYANIPDCGQPCSFTLITVIDTEHLVRLENDALLHGDSYYCFVRKINDFNSFSYHDTRLFLIRKEDGRYLRQLHKNRVVWTARRNKASRVNHSRGRMLIKKLRAKYPGHAFTMTQFITEPHLK